MSGTNPVGSWALPLSTGGAVQDPTTYKGNIDSGFAVAQRVADAFAPRPANPLAMSVVVDPGFIAQVNPFGQQSIAEIGQQSVTIAAAPGAPSSRIDLVVIDAATGAASVLTGTPGSPPSVPAMPPGKRQVARVAVASGAGAITAAAITDLRAVWGTGDASAAPWALAAGSADAITASYAPPTPNPIPDGLILGFRAQAANATASPSFAPDGQTPHPITKKGGAALLAGDIPGASAECLLRYNFANAHWELLNPANTPPAIPSGALMPYAGSSAPSGWLLCDGQAVSRTSYAALFAVIGAGFGGGDGSTTFNLPDLRGRAVFGLDNMGGSAAGRITGAGSGISGTTLGAVGGDEHMQAHGHSASVSDPGHVHSLPLYDAGGANGQVANAANGDFFATTTVAAAATGIGISIGNAGSGGSQNMPPAIMLNIMIKT
jgi:microcystin-dependent protein